MGAWKKHTWEKQKDITFVLLHCFYILCCCRGRFVSEVVMRWSHCLQWLPSKKKFISGNETLVPQVELNIAQRHNGHRQISNLISNSLWWHLWQIVWVMHFFLSKLFIKGTTHPSSSTTFFLFHLKETPAEMYLWTTYYCIWTRLNKTDL